MTVKAEVLAVLINNYPLIPGYKIHNASKKHPFSTTQRLRQLRAEGLIDYEYKVGKRLYHVYTSRKKLERLYKQMGGEMISQWVRV